MRDEKVFTITATSPSNGTAAVAETFVGLIEFDDFTVDGRLTGATDDALDVVVQRKVADDVWVDWYRFPQVAASAAAASHAAWVLPNVGSNTTFTVAQSTDASLTAPALTAGASTGGHPGNTVRVVFFPGASTSAGASQTVRITGRRFDR